MTEGDLIRLERQIAEDTAALQIRLSSQFCPLCGTRLVNGKCQYGCEIESGSWATSLSGLPCYAATPALAEARAARMEQPQPIGGDEDEPKASGNYLAEETAYYAHPD